MKTFHQIAFFLSSLFLCSSIDQSPCAWVVADSDGNNRVYENKLNRLIFFSMFQIRMLKPNLKLSERFVFGQFVEPCCTVTNIGFPNTRLTVWVVSFLSMVPWTGTLSTLSTSGSQVVIKICSMICGDLSA